MDYGDRFDRLWAALAAVGFCDESGGAEYRRVRQEWESAGRPADLLGFIAERTGNGIPPWEGG